MRKRAYLFARDMIWEKVAQGYMASFVRVRSDRMQTPRVQFLAGATPKALNRLPDIKLSHLARLTDDTGVLQHAIFTVPNYGEGYTTDDNARALILRVLLAQPGNTKAHGVHSMRFLPRSPPPLFSGLARGGGPFWVTSR